MNRRELWKKWRRHVNMTRTELVKFLMEYGDTAGLSRSQAKRQGIKSGRDSAKQLLKMIPTGTSYSRAEREWSAKQWDWAKRQVAFIRRMRAAKGPLFDDDGEPTRKLLSLMLWGHDPQKPLRSVS